MPGSIRKKPGPKAFINIQRTWFSDALFKPWLTETNKGVCWCEACAKEINIGYQGRTAIVKHSVRPKHKQNLELLLQGRLNNIGRFTKPDLPNISLSGTVTEAEQLQTSISQPITISSYVDNSLVSNAEVIWVINTVDKNYSANSNNNIRKVLSLMFPDSEIVKKFTCSRTKLSYLMEHGIYPHVKKLLHDQISPKSDSNKPFVILFDESHNEYLKKKQLDYHVRMWCGNKVLTRYLTSEFLGKATSQDLLNCFKELDQKILSLKNLIQVSMDGPNVNLLAHKKIEDSIMKQEYEHKLLNIGSCGLHQVHNAVKGATYKSGHLVGEFLFCLNGLFKYSPARREEFTRHTKCEDFPLPFCKVRWAENILPAKRALHILPHLMKYLLALKDPKANGLTVPISYSYRFVVDWVLGDQLIKAKLLFFIFMIKPVEIFLRKYQSDAPLAPFLVDDLRTMLMNMQGNFLNASDTNKNPSLLNFDDTTIFLPTKKINIGMLANEDVTKLVKEDKISKVDVNKFRSKCKDTMQELVKKISAKSPMNYQLAKHMVCLNPEYMIQHATDRKALRCFDEILLNFKDANLLKEFELDVISDQFKTFLSRCSNIPSFRDFDVKLHRLDVVFFEHLNDKEEYKELWSVICRLLTLSHGQAVVERGFSINKDTMVANQSENSLIARRSIKDHLSFVNGIENFKVTGDLLKSCTQARARYYNAKRDEEKSERIKKNNERKKPLEDEIKGLKNKIKTTQDTVDKMIKEVEDNMDMSEKKEKSFPQLMYKLSKWNSFRESCKRKAEEIKVWEKDILAKEILLKNISDSDIP